MRRIHHIALGFALALVLAPASGRADDWEQEPQGWGEPPPESYDVSVDVNPGGVTLESFQAPLAPYGEWVNAPRYGQVWRPNVAAGWRPYYYGRWEWTNEGWMWVSDEPWGWAAYHYGRWSYDSYYGWIWVPGYQWAPAWVSWRYSGDAIGWAPLAPGFSLYVSTYPFYDYCWTFVPTVSFVSMPVYQVAYAPAYTRQWFYRTAPAPARPAPAPGFRPAPSASLAWGGPAPRFVSERIGRPIAPARIVTAPAPGVRARPGEIPVFRPEARGGAGRAGGAFPAPAPGRQGGWSPPANQAGGRGPGGWAPPASGGRGGWTPPQPQGNGRGPASAPPAGGHGAWAPPRGDARAPGAVPAPGRAGERGWSPPAGEGRGPVAAPPPARGNEQGGWSPPQGGGGGRPTPAPAPAPRGGGRGDRHER